MADKIDNAKGVLFKNDKKTKDTHPDYTGNFALTKPLLAAWIAKFKADPSMEEFKVDIASWIKNGQRGPFLSLSVNAPYDKPAEATKKRDDLSDEIPF